jgi:heat shock protein HslJ
VLALTSGCEITDDEPEIALSDALSALENVEWTLTSFDSITGPKPVIEHTHITLSIDIKHKQLHGTGGCNGYSANFDLNEVTHTMTLFNVVSTEIWCDEPVDTMLQEQHYIATLAQVSSITFTTDTLHLAVGEDAGLHFVTK